jgi:CCR4-NOT transcription complex subunit 2
VIQEVVEFCMFTPSIPQARGDPSVGDDKAATGGAGQSRFGLTGLLSVIRMTDPDLNTLALGTDLTTLGLNLNSTEVMRHAFCCPLVPFD